MIIKQIDWLAPVGIEQFNIYAVGDPHMGARNFAERQFDDYLDIIYKDKNAKWFGGGDLIDAVIFQDAKRFSPTCLPDWLLNKPLKQVREALKDIVKAQIDRLVKKLIPISDKCIGLLEGNHEYAILQHHNRDIMGTLCEKLDVPNLSDSAFIRFKMKRYTSSNNDTATITMSIQHGFGGGRSAGSEPNHLMRLAQERDAEFVFRGHSHTFHIMPPIPRLTTPKTGDLPEHVNSKIIRAANWGCFLLSYAPGDSTYDSRAMYPARPLMTFKAVVQPWVKQSSGKIKMIYKLEEINLE